MESPYVICVGGTDLTTKGPGKGWASETVWVDGGGGISPDHLPIPSWQKLKGVITKANKASTKYRNGPDISANSNFTFYVCADQTTCTANEYGGTSFAAPMWAGYLALANEQAAPTGDKPPGFINPTISPLASSLALSPLLQERAFFAGNAVTLADATATSGYWRAVRMLRKIVQLLSS